MPQQPLVSTGLAGRAIWPRRPGRFRHHQIPAQRAERRADRIPPRPHPPAPASSTSTRSPTPTPTLPHMVPAPARFAKLVGALGVGNDSTGRLLRPEGPRLGRARLVDDGPVRPRPCRRARWRPAEMDRRGPASRSRRSRRAAAGADSSRLTAPARLRGVGDHAGQPRGPATNWCSTPAPPPASAARCRSRGPASAPATSPAAANLPYTELLAPDQTLLPPDALRARLAAAGVDGTRPVVTSCGSGVTACVLTLAMSAGRTAAGCRLRRLLDRMGRPPDTPVET